MSARATAKIHSSPLKVQFLLRWLTGLYTANRIQTLNLVRFNFVDFERAGMDLLRALMSSPVARIDTYSEHAEAWTLMAQIGFISKQRKKWVLALPEAVGTDEVIEAYRVLDLVTDVDGFSYPDRLPPFA